MAKAKDSKLKRAGVSGYNKPKRTPSHPKKSHVVVAKVGSTTKLIRFGNKELRVLVKTLSLLKIKQDVNRIMQDITHKILSQANYQLGIGAIR